MGPRCRISSAGRPSALPPHFRRHNVVSQILLRNCRRRFCLGFCDFHCGLDYMHTCQEIMGSQGPRYLRLARDGVHIHWNHPFHLRFHNSLASDATYLEPPCVSGQEDSHVVWTSVRSFVSRGADKTGSHTRPC